MAEHEDPVDRRRVALAFAYDGRMFDSYARQKDPKYHTVEAALIARLVERRVIRDPDEARFRSGSRTDRGVSARRNVVAFDIVRDGPFDSEKGMAQLPGAIGAKNHGFWPLEAALAPDDFDPRHAIARTYRYHVDPHMIDVGGLKGDDLVARLRDVLHPFVGTHDMRPFAKMEPGRSPMRTIHAIEVLPEAGHGAWVVITGRNFLWNQVRRMVGAACRILDERLPEDTIVTALADPETHAQADLGLAPASPLTLWDVTYPDREFHVASRHAARLRDAWARERQAARMAESLFSELLDDAVPG